MAPRKGSKSVKTSKVLNYNALILKDVLCPICRSILIEPVTLPCNHGFCSSCFDNTMQNANLVCPLCRIRIGSWLRKAKKEVKLINYELWDAIKDKFPQQVKNKMNGIDENLEEETDVIVAYPGEIRKEYEMQKQREDEEFRKKCEADLKASEDLIKKICEEEHYERAVMEEKLKLDEQVAKKLAEELASTNPSTSKTKQTKRFGPMDKFVKQENDMTLQNVQKKQLNNFATKEYTCRVLRLDNNTGNDPYKKIFSPIIPKKVQQIQKIVDTDITSDSSDCIESELRYFKPIDYRGNPPSERKPAIKVPTKKPLQNTSARILSPTGLINFHSNFLESAFARIAFPKSTGGRKSNTSPASDNSTIVSSKLKRTHSKDEINSPKRKIKRKDSVEEIEEESPTLISFSKTSRKKRQIFGKSNNTVKDSSSSPPFLGFEKISDSKDSNSNITNNKNSIIEIMEEEKSKKLLQEMADLEFAKKLQDELNRTAHYTRSSRRRIGSKRQATLDEIIKTPYRVK
ncbi:E3 ubiquitin-protein ligase RNF169-like [Anoplophora glabripennis]|uniref:E3 ubiquitin-protein ligase RNF169-like n=1 Tax=Anoplophora glabripennis TaxID=217634 RepID=UPI0008734F5A|nr:E3 ubiquitin-protein ligase RNF169-like [Anoplophora glabripennis]